MTNNFKSSTIHSEIQLFCKQKKHLGNFPASKMPGYFRSVTYVHEISRTSRFQWVMNICEESSIFVVVLRQVSILKVCGFETVFLFHKNGSQTVFEIVCARVDIPSKSTDRFTPTYYLNSRLLIYSFEERPQLILVTWFLFGIASQDVDVINKPVLPGDSSRDFWWCGCLVVAYIRPPATTASFTTAARQRRGCQLNAAGMKSLDRPTPAVNSEILCNTKIRARQTGQNGEHMSEW